MAEKLGQRCFRVSIPNNFKNKIIIGEYTTARRILADPLSSKPIEIYGAMRSLNGRGESGMFTLNGPRWHSKRKATANAFSSNLIKRMNEAALDYTDVFVENLKSEESKRVFDVSEAMLSVVLSALAESAFDYVISVEESAIMMHELELALIEFASKTPTQIHRKWVSWLIPERRRAVAATLKLRELMCRIMKNYRDNGPKSEGTIIQLVMKNDGAFKTDDEKLAQLLEFFIAGTRRLLDGSSLLRIASQNLTLFDTRARDYCIQHFVGANMSSEESADTSQAAWRTIYPDSSNLEPVRVP